MFLSDVSIRRPVFATMMNLVLIVFGLFALPRLAVDQYPNVDFPVVTVTVVYPGADPQSVEQRVLDPLEDAVNGLSGLKTLASNAYPNVAQMVLQFDLNKDSDQAAQETRDRVFAAVGQLPPETDTPVVQKFDIGGAPIINMALTSSDLPYGQLSALASDLVTPALERVVGVASINSAGIRERVIQVRLDRERLTSFSLTPLSVTQSLQQQNLNMPAGTIKTDQNYWSLRVNGQVTSADQIANIPILAAPSLRIGDVASVTDTIEEEETAAYIGKTPTILLSVQKQSGANTTDVADGIRETVASLGDRMPAGTNLEIVSDNSVYIKGSIDSVKLDLMVGAILATVIVFIFLRNVWITVISAIALPTAVIATFAFLDFMGFSLNMMTTLGLSLSIGILIDDAIIVIENIHRHLSMGKTGAAAAKDATTEIGLAVLATTLTICAVFVPVAFMEGIIGRFFFQFGLTVAFAVLVSLFCAFTIAPMLSARLLKEGEHEPKRPILARLWWMVEKALGRLDAGYRRVLGWCLDHRAVTLVAGLVTFIVSVVMLRFVPVAFFPQEDRSQFSIVYELPEGTTLETTKRHTFALVDEIQKYPGIERVVSALGATRDQKPNKARLDVVMIAREQRSFSQSALMHRMRTELVPKFAVDGAELTISEAGGHGGHAQPIQLIFKSSNWDSLVAYTDKVAEFIRSNVVGAVDVSTTKPKVQEEFRVIVDHSRAADLLVSSAEIGATLRALFEGDKVSEIEQGGETFDVQLRIADKDRVSPEDIASVTLTNRQGEIVTLGAIADIEKASAPAVIERYEGQRQITVLSNFAGKDLNAAVDQINEFVGGTIPSNIAMSLSGETEIMKDAIGSMLQALGIAVLLVLIILCAQYERYLAPLVIMAALPLSLTGAFGALLVTGQTLSVFTMIGIILLMGLVTKNGILLIDFTLQRIRDGLPVRDALMEAGPVRLRPILMTTFAAGGGMLPVAIGHGVGGEARSPMGVAVIGGLLMSTLLTLVVVPCLFSVVEGARSRMARRRGKKKKEVGEDKGGQRLVRARTYS